LPLVDTIIANHSDRESVAPGELVVTRVDRIYMHDGNTPTIARLYKQHGFTKVFDPARVAAFFDHAVLAPDAKMTTLLREAENFAAELGIKIYRAGSGISHVVALEEGWFTPGSLVCGSDSHTCTGGVMQCLALGMGASDVVGAMVSGKTWLRVPETVWIEVIGTPGRFTRAKDVVLYALAKFGQKPFLYASVEWTGEWLESLSLDAAATISNMAVELGAKCVFLPPGPLRPSGLAPICLPEPGDERRLRLDVDGLPPFVALPHSPANAVPLDECAGQEIDYVFFGSCANARLEDMCEFAEILTRAPVHPRVHCVVTPGSQSVYLAALRSGVVERITQAGGLLMPPGCGPCVGTQGTIPASGDRVLSTMNRNFRGRMGNADAKIWLASPLVAAYTAIMGRIPGTADLE
jgi:3-isopropylmalate/(R)-2-methylmalate dehydratase large subunit